MIRIIDGHRDLEYLIESHCRIYKQEHHFDNTFKDYIIQSVSDFSNNRSEGKSQIWIIDMDGSLKGTIGIIDIGNETAQLRWFLIEPDYRGNGLGKDLLRRAIQFCIDNHFKRVILWTSMGMVNARKLYEDHKFIMTESRTQILSKQEITEEKWEMKL